MYDFARMGMQAVQEFQNVEAQTRYLEMQQDQLNAVVYWSLIPLVLAFIFLFFVLYRSRREATFRKKTYELELARSDMEMKALRAQVNPHFIFNCLSSIQHFISQNNNQEAEYYLVRFSRLIRQVLENSTQRMITLGDDLATLDLYMEMEALRLNQGFDFSSQLEPSIDPEAVFVPPLLIQPLLENAIWHGSSVEGQNKITMRIFFSDGDLICEVENPYSHKSLEKNPIKQKSLGLELIRDRIKVLNHLYNRDEELRVEDVHLPQENYFGKRVSIVLPFETDD